MHFIGIKVCCRPDDLDKEVQQARRELLSQQFHVSGLENPDEQFVLTLPQDHENTEDTITTYVGFEVKQFGDAPEGWVRMDLAGGRYAQFAWHGSLEAQEFESFYPGLFNWFREQGLAPSTSKGWMEIYGNDFDWDDRADPDNRFEAIIPIGGGSR